MNTLMQIGTKLECKLCYGSTTYMIMYNTFEDTYVLITYFIHIGIFMVFKAVYYIATQKICFRCSRRAT